MIYKRFIILLILCIPIANHAINESSVDQEESISRLVESCEKAPDQQDLVRISASNISVLVKPSCATTWSYLKPFSKYLVNLLFGLGASYSLYRYAPDKFPWIWAGASTYTSLVLGAAVVSYGKENKTLKEEKKELIQENNSLQSANGSLQSANERLQQRLNELQKSLAGTNLSSAAQDPEVIVVRCSLERENLEAKLKQQQEKTVALCKSADELETEVLQLRYEKKNYLHLKNSYQYLLGDKKVLEAELQQWERYGRGAHQKIMSLEEKQKELINKICDLQNQLNIKEQNRHHVACARERLKNVTVFQPGLVSVNA